MTKLTVYTDGASRGNPGLSGYGFVIKDETGQIIKEDSGFLGTTTNNVAEYTAVLKAFEYLVENFPQGNLKILVTADSRLIIEQLSGRFKIKSPHLQGLFFQIRKLEGRLGKISYTHVIREQNKEADALANLGIDRNFKS